MWVSLNQMFTVLGGKDPLIIESQTQVSLEGEQKGCSSRRGGNVMLINCALPSSQAATNQKGPLCKLNLTPYRTWQGQSTLAAEGTCSRSWVVVPKHRKEGREEGNCAGKHSPRFFSLKGMLCTMERRNLYE